jgi:hypothetical protein
VQNFIDGVLLRVFRIDLSTSAYTGLFSNHSIVSVYFVYIICIMILTVSSKVPFESVPVHAQSYVSNCSFEAPCHSLMWKATFSHEILLDCTVNNLHVRGGNTAYQNCLIVRHFTCRNPLSCSER